MDAPADGRQPDTLATLVRHLERALPEGGEMTVGQFLLALGVHGFIFFLLVLAFLNIVIFMLPGLSIVFGVPMVILAVQLLLGHKAPVFPAFVRRQALSLPLLRKGLDFSASVLEKIDPKIKPRLLFLTAPVTLRIHALAALFLAFMVAIPVPFINMPPSLGMALLTIGLLQRDGLFILLAYGVGAWSFSLYESLGQAAQRAMS